jgi:hypothetical protein
MVASPAHAAPFVDYAVSGAPDPAEEGDLVTFTITRDSIDIDPLPSETLPFMLSGGTAGVDYTNPSVMSVTFASLDAEETVTVQTSDDNAVESAETLTLTLLEDGDPDSNPLASGGVTIQDNDAAYTVADSGAPEGESIIFTVQRSGSGALPAEDVTFALSGVTTAVGDYTVPSNTTVNFAEDATSQQVMVETTHDAVPEPDETFTFALSADGVEVDTAIGTIVNNDVAPTYVVDDAETIEGGAVTFTVKRTGELTMAAETVSIALAPGSPSPATPGDDFGVATPLSLSFPEGTGGDALQAQVVTVPTVRDADVGPETFTLTVLDEAENGLAAAVGTILDIGYAVSVDGPATEGEDDLTFEISRSADADLPGVTLTYAVTGGTATAADFGTVATPIQFEANDGSTQTATFVLPIDDDLRNEPQETVTVTFYENGVVVGSATGTILDDNDAEPTYSLAVEDTSIEEDAGPLTITATLSEASGYDITIPVYTVNGTAVAPGDFTALTYGAGIQIAAGQTQGDITVGIVGDAIDEADQTFTVFGAPNLHVAGSDAVMMTILDDDLPPVLSIAAAGVVNEGDPLTFTVTLAGARERDVTVHWATEAGSATADADFTPTADGTLTFTPQQPTRTLTVETLPDDVDEATPETLTVRLSAPENAVLDPEHTTAIGQIDDTTAAPSLKLTPVEVDEGDAGTTTDAKFTVELVGTTELAVLVDYAITGGTATEGADFEAEDGTLAFEPGDTDKTISIDIVGDNTDELNETIIVTLANSGGTVTGAGLGANTITILDDDEAPTFTVDDRTHLEGDDLWAAVFTVTLSRTSSRNIDFMVTPSDDTAVDMTEHWGSNDYDAPAAQLVIPAGDTQGRIFVPVNGDQVYEADEKATIEVALEEEETAAVGDPVTGTLTIRNDDNKPKLTVNSETGDEGETVALTGSVDGMAQANIVYTLNIAGGSVLGSAPASAGDFELLGSNSYTLAGGTAPGPVGWLTELKLIDDEADEPNETILVGGEGVNGGVVTIVDTDEPAGQPTPVTLTAPESRVGIGPVTVSGKAAPGAQVDILVAHGGTGTLTKMTTVTANGTGDFTHTHSFTLLGGRFQARSGDQLSPVRTVRLLQAPRIGGSSQSAGTVQLKVVANPALPGAAFEIQRATATGAFTTVFTGKLGTDGTSTKTLTGQTRGTTFRYRAFVHGSDYSLTTGANSTPYSIRIQ